MSDPDALDDAMLAAWRMELAAELADHDQAGGDPERREELVSVADLIRHGLDRRGPRLLRGHVLTELRCAARRHLLGRVYGTAAAPVLVPQIASSAGLGRRTVGGIIPPRAATPGGVAHGYGPMSSADSRTWIGQRMGRIGIVGLTVLGARTLRTVPQVSLVCRCGRPRDVEAGPGLLAAVPRLDADTPPPATTVLLVDNSGTVFGS